MKKIMKLDLYLLGGGFISKELYYMGESLEEIAAAIDRDNNSLLEYMRTKNDFGEKCFCFCGFMFEKSVIFAAQLYEPDILEVL